VDCLPTELPQFKGALYGHCCGRSSEDVVKILQGYAYGSGLNDQLSRPLPKAAAVLPKSQSQDPAADHQSQTEKSHARSDAGSVGAVVTSARSARNGRRALERSKLKTEVSDQCPMPSASASNGTHVPCPQHVQAVHISLPSVTFNVLQSGWVGHSCEEWLLDSGATVHRVVDLVFCRTPRFTLNHVLQLTRQLQLATSESHGSIIASGSVCLVNAERYYSGSIMHRCVPQAGTNLLSVSAEYLYIKLRTNLHIATCLMRIGACCCKCYLIRL
jgi:hypothetical protein